MPNLKKQEETLRQILEDLASHNFEYQQKGEKPINWSSYTEYQVNELKYFLKYVREVVDNIQLPQDRRERGRPPSDAKDLAKVILLQQYFCVSERAAIGLAELLKERLGITSDLSQATLSRAYQRWDVMYILKKLFDKTNEPFAELEKNFSGDGTGISTSMKRNWDNDKDDDEKRGDFMKIALMIGNDSHITTSVAINPDGNAAESRMLPMLLNETASRYDINEVCLDAAYLSRENCNLIAELGATPFIYPKRNVLLKQRGSPAWKEMLTRFIENPREWLRHYYRRENSESAISAQKRRFVKPVKGKTNVSKITEVYTRVCCYNVTRVVKAYFTMRIKVKEFERNHRSYL